MAADHYAIVIGLSSYPNLGDPPPANLQGPENDADAVHAWLTNPNEGGLPEGNVKRICSRDFTSPPDAKPTRDSLDDAFRWLDDLAAKHVRIDGARIVGRRLYLYASGHGFSPRFHQGCLLTGNASERDATANISPSLWLDWLKDAGYFREYVLWLDCCMDRLVLVQPQPPPLLAINAATAPGASFVAFAASRPLKAVEKPIGEDDGKFHGIFTWNLLRGLRGAAANRFGFVTGSSLADWLRHSQLGWLEGLDLQNPDISKEPVIIDNDEGLVFARGLAPALFNVEIAFPDGMAVPGARIWSGESAAPGPLAPITEGRLKARLPAGLHLVEAPATGIRHGLSVTRDQAVTASEKGKPVEQTDGLFQINIDPGDPNTEIRLIGARLQTIIVDSGGLSARLPYGLYAVRIRVGREIIEKVVLLDSDWKVTADQLRPKLPEITSAAPLPNTAATHETQQAAAATTDIHVHAGTGAQLMVMTRFYTSPQGGSPGAQPWAGVTVRDMTGKIVADMSTDGQRDEGTDPFSVCTISLPPGAYLLCRPGTGGLTVATSLILPPNNWRLEAYLLHRPGFSEPVTAPARSSLLMRRINEQWASGDDLLMEKARVALADERPILNDELTVLLLQKFRSPLSGIIGGHLLLLAIEKGVACPALGLLNDVVRNLRALVGTDHPDVEALSLACQDSSLRRTAPVTAAPLFERSWRMLVHASEENPDLVPASLWSLVHTSGGQLPLLCWVTDESVREGFLKQLAGTLFAQGAEPANGGRPQPAASPMAILPAPAAGPERPAAAPSLDAEAARQRASLLGLPQVAVEELRKIRVE